MLLKPELNKMWVEAGSGSGVANKKMKTNRKRDRTYHGNRVHYTAHTHTHIVVEMGDKQKQIALSTFLLYPPIHRSKIETSNVQNACRDS